MEALIEKEKQNASKLQVPEELNRGATETADEQHCRLKEVRFNLTTPLTSEASEPENYGEARPKTTSRAKLMPGTPNTLPQRGHDSTL